MLVGQCEIHFGYKNHIAIDSENQLVRDYEVTSAEVHKSQVFTDLLTENSSADVWAGSAYQSSDNELELFTMGHRCKVHKKGSLNRPLSDK